MKEYSYSFPEDVCGNSVLVNGVPTLTLTNSDGGVNCTVTSLVENEVTAFNGVPLGNASSS
jgi:hypothetical protein